MKSIIILLIIGVTILLVFSNTYMSSPGFTTQEDAKYFYEHVPNCFGLSFVLNKKATWADAPEKSICIGILQDR